MGLLSILIGALIGAGSAAKKNFTQCWIFCVNLCFSLYSGIFLAPPVASMLEIPNLAAGYKNAIALGGIFIIADIVLNKITEQIFPDSDVTVNLPPAAAKIGSAAAGFFSGALITAVLIYCFMQIPVTTGLPVRKNFRAAAGKTLLVMVHSLNSLSFQRLTPAGKEDLKDLGILPKMKKKAESGTASTPDQPSGAENGNKTDKKTSQDNNSTAQSAAPVSLPKISKH
ncbi:MAG: hypothetical protein J5858_11230 [Lentisphaeria bacterium]|nr:hypothetical protein [Lentisphaeria bacterium]